MSLQISDILRGNSTFASSVTQEEMSIPKGHITRTPPSCWLGTLWHDRDLCPRVKQLFWALANRSYGLTKSVNRATTSYPHILTTPAFSSPFSRSHGTLPCMEGHEGWHTCEHMALPSWGKCTQRHMVLPSSSSANTGRALPELQCVFFHMVEIVHENG